MHQLPPELAQQLDGVVAAIATTMRRIEEIDAALSEIGAAIARRDRQAQELDAAIAGRLAAIERQIAAEDHEANLEASRLRSMLEEAHAAFGGKF